MTTTKDTTVQILGRNYHIKCTAEEAMQLQESARYLDQEIRKLHHSTQTNNIEQLAIVAALNITHELMSFKNQKNAYIDVMHNQIKTLQDRIRQFLNAREEAI